MPASPEVIVLGKGCADTFKQTACKSVGAGKQCALCSCSLNSAAVLITALDPGAALHLQKNMSQECQRPSLSDLCIHFIPVPFHLLPLFESSRFSHVLTNAPPLLRSLLPGRRLLLTGCNRAGEGPLHFQISSL